MDNVPEVSNQVKVLYKSGKELLDAQHERARRVVEKNPWAKAAFSYIRERCTHVSEFDLTRLFDGKSQSHEEFIIGAALFHEYNALNPLSLPRNKRAIPVYRPPVRAPEPVLKPLPKSKATKEVKAAVKPAKPAKAPAKVAVKVAVKVRVGARKAKAVRPKPRVKKAPARKTVRPARLSRKAKGGKARRR